MKRFATAFLAGVAMTFALSAVAEAKDKTIAVSWKTFQEERWKTDEAAIKAVVEAAGDTYVSTDAQGSAAEAGRRHRRPDLAEGRRHPGRRLRLRRHPAVVQGGQRCRHQDDLLRRAGRRSERALHHLRQCRRRPPDGPGNARRRSRKATMPSSRATRAIRTPPSCSRASWKCSRTPSTSGKIKNVCETFTDGWKPDNAQKNMEQCLTSTDNKVDAVVSENDGMASRRRGGARRPGPGRLRSGDRPGRRQGRAQPRRPRHADRVGLEGLARSRQGCRRSRRRHRRRH